MTALRKYVLRLFISVKHITVDVMDRNNNGRIVASASTVEHTIKDAFDCSTANAKVASAVGEVLAMRLKVEGFHHGDPERRGIHADVNKEIQKKGSDNATKIWAVVNALKDNGVKLILDDESWPSS